MSSIIEMDLRDSESDFNHGIEYMDNWNALTSVCKISLAIL